MERRRKIERWGCRVAIAGLVVVAVIHLLGPSLGKMIDEIERWQARPRLDREVVGVIDAYTGDWGNRVKVRYQLKCEGWERVPPGDLPQALVQRCKVENVDYDLDLDWERE